jgi:sarcosine oxidase, subunit alpha
MTQPFRLPSGGRIDRNRPIRFRFNNETIDGFGGDTVASALLANGRRLVGRSFKYHRPRGILSHGSDEPNALLQVDRGPGRIDPNNRATIIEAVDGLVTHSQNHWPSLEHDFASINDALSALLPAGFYYKTFKWPRSFWERLYEPAIRAVAGLGVAPESVDPDRYGHRYAHCELLIVGAGAAGLAAARAAAESGKRIILADEQAEIGGSLLHEASTTIDGIAAAAWLAQTLELLAARDNVTVLPRTTAFGNYHYNLVAMAERSGTSAQRSDGRPRERLWLVRAKKIILATGAHERALVFPNNDRPGILLAESIRAYVNRYAVAPGRRIVFATSGASAYRAAIDTSAAGVHVTIVDTRSEHSCGPELGALRSIGVEVLNGQRVIGASGRKSVDGLVVTGTAGNGAGAYRTIPCDCVGMSGGWTPAVHLFAQSGGVPKFSADIDAFVPGPPTPSQRSIGSANGTYDLNACLAEGFQTGLETWDELRPHAFSVEPPTWIGSGNVPFPAGGGNTASGKAFVDFQNDVVANDIALAVREGFESVEHVKRYTTSGMATDQGKTSNMAMFGLLAGIRGLPISDVGTTTFRPPYTPVTFGTLVGPSRGELFDPIRKTPLHDWAQTHGAKFENVGLWRRARHFPIGGENMNAAVSRECHAVRSSVGLFDASTLGKIEVVGPDAAEFLNRLYVNSFRAMTPGQCRYGIMLKEDGHILDDGVVARLATDRFHVTTTTGGAARVLSHMEDYLQTEWQELNVYLTSTTEQWAVIAVQGPKARDLIAPLISGIDLAASSFPHMHVRVGEIGGIPMRLFRVSFTGELGYEINVPSGHGHAVWAELYARGERFGVVAYGTDAMHVLRAEKGYLVVGQETDGTVTPDDVGLGRMVAKGDGDFVGKRSLARRDLIAAGRRQLVGLLTKEPRLVLDEGAQIVSYADHHVSHKSLGHVTSSYWSETCDHSIALALLENGRARVGSTLHVTGSGMESVRVTEPIFYDKSGARLHG